MSGGTLTPPLPQQSPTPSDQPVVNPESPLGALIEDRIHRTRRQVKGVDIITGLLTLIVGALTYLFIAALIDQWVVTGGLGFWGRLVLWAILISAAGLYFVKCLWPALALSINPVFAARTIEQSKPALKNSLINFLLLRGRQRELAPVIYQALEQRAAADLKGVRIETAVDRRPILQLSYLLAVVVSVICLYLALSPKSPITSAVRILWPWSSVRAPTRVTIENVQPGDAVAFHGDFVAVSADVRGLDEGEPVLLHYSTADGEIIDQVVPMTLEGGAYRRQGKLPPDTLGLQQDYTYFVTAGDFRTVTYKIETQISPVIVVDRVDYHYPPYTGIPDGSIERQGDIRAIEGAQVTIHATANQPIDRSEIDFSLKGMRGIEMKVEDRSATGRFTLRMQADDPTRAEHDFYQLRFTDKKHRENRRPIRYGIEVLRDLPPDVQIVAPQKEEAAVAADGKLEIRIRAEDPDFGLSRVTLKAEREKQILNIPPLLDARPPDKPHAGEFLGKYDFEPSKLKLKPGDRVAYWAEAEDNEDPSPNITATAKQWIIVIAPENPQAKNDQQPHRAQRPGEQSDKGSQDQQPNNQQPNQQPQAGQQQDDQNQQNQGESKSPDKGETDKKGDKSETGEKNEENGKSDTGEQGEKGRNENKSDTPEKSDTQEKGKKGEKGDKGEKGGAADQSKQKNQSDTQQTPGDQSQSDQQGKSSQSDKSGGKTDKSQSGNNQQQSAGQQANQNREPIDSNSNPGDAFQEILKHRQEEEQKEQQKAQPNNQQADKQQTGKQQSGNQQTGNQQSGNQQSSGQQSADKQSADKQSGGQQKTGQQTTGGQQSGEKQQSGNQQPLGEKKAGEKQSATGEQPGEKKQSGEKQSGEKQSATGEQPGEKKQPGEKQLSGEKKSLGDKQPSGDKQQAGGKQGEKQPGQAGLDQNKKPEEGQSPGMSPKPSDTKGETAGDRSGDGEKGGGQQANKPGGVPGSQTPVDEGGQQAKGQGQGEMGDKPGDQAKSDEPTATAAKQQAGQGSNGQKQPGGEGSGLKQQQSPDSSAGQGQQKPPDGSPDGGPFGNQLGKGPTSSGSGNPLTGGQQGTTPDVVNEPETQQSAADAINLDYARKQTELALEHLEDQLAKDQPELLEQLGWTREQAQRFIDRWQQLRQAADEKSPRGEAAKKQLDDALKSLGLRPGTTFLKHGGTKADQLRDLRDSGRFAPPADWAEQFREYTRGVANQGKEQGTADGGQRTGDKQ